MSNRSPAVSVATPFHNTAAYLEECIESVLAQTFSDFEYILVDNQSTDGSTEIAERYARRDSRIRLVRTDRLLTQVQNYNFALSLISPTTRWCKIVQADDWIMPEYLARSVPVGDSSPNVGIVSAYALNGVEVRGSGLSPATPVVDGRTICRMHLIEDRFLFGTPTAVLYRASIVRERVPFYEEHRLHEDTEVCYELLRTWDFGFVHQVLAFQRTDNEGITSRLAGFEPHLLDKYIVLTRFGQDFLSTDERREILGRFRRRYDRCLGEGFLGRRGPAFWAHHRAGLASIGERAGARRIVRGVMLALAHHLTRPLDSAQRVRRRFSRAARRPGAVRGRAPSEQGTGHRQSNTSMEPNHETRHDGIHTNGATADTPAPFRPSRLA